MVEEELGDGVRKGTESAAGETSGDLPLDFAMETEVAEKDGKVAEGDVGL